MSSKLREALEKVKERVGYFYTKHYIGFERYNELFDICSEALAEPLRNCDVGTPEEQKKRLLQEVDNGKVKLEGTITEIIFKWSQMPYKKEGEE